MPGRGSGPPYMVRTRWWWWGVGGPPLPGRGLVASLRAVRLRGRDGPGQPPDRSLQKTLLDDRQGLGTRRCLRRRGGDGVGGEGAGARRGGRRCGQGLVLPLPGLLFSDIPRASSPRTSSRNGPLSVARRRGSGASAQRARRSHGARAQRGVAAAVCVERRQAGKVGGTPLPQGGSIRGDDRGCIRRRLPSLDDRGDGGHLPQTRPWVQRGACRAGGTAAPGWGLGVGAPGQPQLQGERSQRGRPQRGWPWPRQGWSRLQFGPLQPQWGRRRQRRERF